VAGPPGLTEGEWRNLPLHHPLRASSGRIEQASRFTRTRSLPRSPRLGYQLGSYPSVKDPRVLFYTLFEIVGYLISIVVMLVIVQFVLSLLIAFNVVNTSNNFVSAIWQAVNALLDPILQPIRRIMPNTGAIDFSPMVLIVGLEVIRIILRNLAVAAI
jgi:YggT family protein